MNKTIYFLIIFLIQSLLYDAQTINATTFNPQIGEVFTIWASSSTVDVGTPGINKTWDFSSVKGGNVISSSTIAANDNATLFPTASYVSSYSGNRDYFECKSDGIYYLGFTSWNSNSTVYPVPSKSMSYPLYKGMQITDSVSSAGSVFTSAFTGDATGTLTTCFKTYTNTLRVKYTIKSANTVLVVVEDGYVWYEPGTHTEIFKYRTVYNNGTPHGPTAFIYDDPSVYAGIGEHVADIEQVHVFPSPVNDVLYLELTKSGGAEVSCRLFDLVGREIEIHPNRIYNDRLEISCEVLPPGVYLLSLKSQNGQVIGVKKIVKS